MRRRLSFMVAMIATTVTGAAAALVACGGATEDGATIATPAGDDSGGGSFGASCQTTCNGFQACKATSECLDGGACATYTCFNQSVSLCRKPQFGCQ